MSETTEPPKDDARLPSSPSKEQHPSAQDEVPTTPSDGSPRAPQHEEPHPPEGEQAPTQHGTEQDRSTTMHAHAQPDAQATTPPSASEDPSNTYEAMEREQQQPSHTPSDGEQLVLDLLPEVARALSEHVRARTLPKTVLKVARQQLRATFAWEQAPTPRDLDAGLTLLRRLEEILALSEDQEDMLAAWDQAMRARLHRMRWPVYLNCVRPDNWSAARAIDIADEMARVRLERMQAVLDTMQVDLGIAGGSGRPQTLEEKRQEAMRSMQQRRASLPLVEG